MRKTKDSKRKIFRYAIIALLVVFLLSAALLFLKIWEVQQGRFPASNTEQETVKYNGTEYVLKENIDTFLVLGLDKFEDSATVDSYNNDRQADFLMLFVYDNDSKECSAIHINRDTMAQMNVLGVAGNKIDTVIKQIALAHTYGNGRNVSCRNTANAVSELLLGMKIDHYISFSMDSVATFNDLVGGVELTVLNDFTGIDDTLIEGETVTLNGEQAFHYVRTRYGLEDSSNSARMERQQQYLKALYAKTQQCIENDDEFIVEASVKMSDYIISDRSVTQLQEIARKFSEYEFNDITSIEGEFELGKQFMEFYPDEESIKKTVIELFYEPKE